MSEVVLKNKCLFTIVAWQKTRSLRERGNRDRRNHSKQNKTHTKHSKRKHIININISASSHLNNDEGFKDKNPIMGISGGKNISGGTSVAY